MSDMQKHHRPPNPIMKMPDQVWRQYIEPKRSLFDQVETLPEDEKIVLALHYYEGLSFREIAMLLSIDEWSAVTLHSQALSKLQTRLKDIF